MADVQSGWQGAIRAAQRASEWHAGQKHKDEESPYITHLIEVAHLVTEASAGDAILTAGAFLHDAIEKADIAAERIEAEFGSEVRALVEELSDDPSLDKQERRERQAATAPRLSRRAKLVKLADKTSNLRSLSRGLSGGMNREEAEDYAASAETVGRALQGTDSWLEAQFEAALRAVRERLKQG